jgi:hypothetical protein
MESCTRTTSNPIARIAITVLCFIPIPAHAVCPGSGPPQYFSQYYDHITSDGMFTAESLTGSFWAFGFGNPAPNAGTDNGAFGDENWIVSYISSSGGQSLFGSWSQSSAIDGCIEGKIAPGKTSEIMIVMLSDRLGGYYSSLFAIAAVARHADESPPFDFSAGIGRDIRLWPISKPLIDSSVQVGAHTIQLVVQGPTVSWLENGFYSDGSVSLPEVVVGYRLYFQPYTFGTSFPDIRRESGWTPITGTVPIGQLSTLNIDCTRVYEYLALSLVYENGVESPYLSNNSTTIKCEMCQGDADADGRTHDARCGDVDCDDTDAHTYGGAIEINDGKDNQCPGDSGFGIADEIDGLGGFATPGDKAALSWPEQSRATGYQIGRSIDPTFTQGCASFLSASPAIVDPQSPPANAAFFYVIRATAPHLGSWGKTSAGNERQTVCP